MELFLKCAARKRLPVGGLVCVAVWFVSFCSAKFSLENISDIMDPVSIEDFHSNAFGKNVLHFKREDSSSKVVERRTSLFNYEHLVEVIKTRSLKPLDNVKFVFHDTEVFVDGEFDQNDPGSSATTVELAEKHFDEGHTMMIQHANKVSDRLHKTSCTIYNAFGHNAGINLYYSPANATGFLLHHDGHDLVIVQTIGSKCWKLCEQPSEDQLPVDAKHYTNDPYQNPEGLKCRMVGLRAGDMLYLPRGTLHAPHTMACKGHPDVGGDPSMHLSVGIDVLKSRWLSVLQETLRMHVNKGKVYTVSCASSEKTSFIDGEECDSRRLSYPPLVPFLFAGNQSWAWVNVLEVTLIITIQSNKPVSRYLREHFPIEKFGLQTEHRIDETSEAFQGLRTQYSILVQLLASACSKLLKGFIKRILTKRNVPLEEAKRREFYVRKHCKAAFLENFKPKGFVPTLIMFLRSMRRRFSQKCLAESSAGKPPPGVGGGGATVPSWVKKKVETVDSEGGINPDYNQLRQMGVDERAMKAIRDLLG